MSVRMADLEDLKLRLPPESAAAIAKVTKEQCDWILRQMPEVRKPSSDIELQARDTGLRVHWLLETTAFLEKLGQAREPQEMDQLLEFDLRSGLPAIGKMFDLKSFPNYERIVADAIVHCLNQTMQPKGSRRTWIRHAITIKTALGRDITFNDSTTPGYTDGWKAAFVDAIHDNKDLALSIAEVTDGEVNFREIPNYEQLVKDAYYRLMFNSYGREDEIFRGRLGDGIEFSERDEKVVEKMNECLKDTRNLNVRTVLYIINKFGEEITFGPDNIKDFEKGVKAAFLCCLQHGDLSVPAAKKIKAKLGTHVNFDDEVRQGVIYNLDHYKDNEDHRLKIAVEIKEILGKGVDFFVSPECHRAVGSACMRMLQAPVWRIEYAALIKDAFGDALNLNEEVVPGYTAIVQERFLREIREGNSSNAVVLKVNFGQGLALDADNLSGYKSAVREGFTDLIDKVHVQDAKALTDDFETGAKIEDKAAIVQRKFISLLNEGDWDRAVEIKAGFEPEIMCDRTNVAEYDDAFRICLNHSFSRSRSDDVIVQHKLCKKLGEGVDITNILQKLVEEDPRKFINFSNKAHWIAIFGEPAVNQFLSVLPKRSDEKRNAFTHNPHDRTSQFINFLWGTGNLKLDAESFALMTNFVERFGLSRSQTLYQYFCSLSRLGEGQPVPATIAAEGITSLDDLEARITNLRQRVYSAEPITDLSGLRPIELDLLAVVTGKSTHSFDGGLPSIGEITGDFDRDQKTGEIAGVPDGYQVESIVAPEVSIDFDPDAIDDDYQVLKREILASVEDPGNPDIVKAHGLRIIDEKLRILRSKGEAKHITDQIEKITVLVQKIAAAQDLDTLMILLIGAKFMGKNNPCYTLMRQIVFRKMIIKNRCPEAVADMLARLGGDDISGQNILEIIGVVDDTIKHHVLNLDGDNRENYWTESAWKALRSVRQDTSLVDVRKIFDPHIGHLKDAAHKFILNETGKTATVKSIPDRGFVGEMSGYLANVCYTKEYPLLKPRPNLVPHKFVIGEGKEAEFFGSYLTFELEEDTGDKIMLVRGFNVPREASIDIGRFIEMTLDKLQATAQSRGITKIVIPGEMGALTNYPLTKNYLYNKYIVKRTPIKLKEKFNFNNFDLTEQCFVVR